MLNGFIELWLVAYAVYLITGAYGYVIYTTGGVPAAGELFGHTIGIFGFFLMILTEIAYSIRKRSRTIRFGRMSDWLRFHIFTGTLGPFMVLLHTSWKFNGLAGVVTLLMVLVVFSGMIGRYIYTQIPRTSEGIELDTSLGDVQTYAIANTRRLMALWHSIHVPFSMAMFVIAFFHIGGAIYYSTLLK
jgi:hypothetical protein